MLKRVLILLAALLLGACVASDRQQVQSPEVAVHQRGEPKPTIALLGATGMVGGYLLKEALAQGYAVRALARTPAKLDAFANDITIIQGDARDAATLDELLRGTDVVISALGPSRADGDAANSISTTATGHILELMPKYDIRRYLIVSGASVEMPGDKLNLTGWLVRNTAVLTLNDTVNDKRAEYRLLAESSADWILVRCPLIKDEAFRDQPYVSLKSPSSWSLRAGELARFMVDQLNSDAYLKQGPFLDSR